MIEVSDIQVLSYELDHLDITWRVPDTDEDLERYNFTILRSVDGPEGPFSAITGVFDSTFLFRDPDVHLLHPLRRYYYQIKVVHKDTGSEQLFGPATLEAPPDLITLEMRRRMNFVQREFIGRKALLFPVLTFGQRCPVCWDKGPRGNYTGRETQQNCATCFDKRYVGGFAKPILIRIQVDPHPAQKQVLDTHETDNTVTTARTSAYPPLKPGDMVVEAENKRWHVETVPQTEKLRAAVRLEPTLRIIPRADIRYSVPVDSTVLADPSPEREYTRPMTLG